MSAAAQQRIFDAFGAGRGKGVLYLGAAEPGTARPATRRPYVQQLSLLRIARASLRSATNHLTRPITPRIKSGVPAKRDGLLKPVSPATRPWRASLGSMPTSSRRRLQSGLRPFPAGSSLRPAESCSSSCKPQVRLQCSPHRLAAVQLPSAMRSEHLLKGNLHPSARTCSQVHWERLSSSDPAVAAKTALAESAHRDGKPLPRKQSCNANQLPWKTSFFDQTTGLALFGSLSIFSLVRSQSKKTIKCINARASRWFSLAKRRFRLTYVTPGVTVSL